MTSTESDTHYTCLRVHADQTLNDLAYAVGNPQHEATVLTRLAGITSAAAAFSPQVHPDDPAVVIADRDAATVAMLLADLARARATGQPRTATAPGLEDDGGAAAVLDALASDDLMVAAHDRAASLEALARVLTENGINAEIAASVAHAYRRSSAHAGRKPYATFHDQPDGDITRPRGAVVLVSGLTLFFAGVALTAAFLAHDVLGKLLGEACAVMAGYLLQWLTARVDHRLASRPGHDPGDNLPISPLPVNGDVQQPVLISIWQTYAEARWLVSTASERDPTGNPWAGWTDVNADAHRGVVEVGGVEYLPAEARNLAEALRQAADHSEQFGHRAADLLTEVAGPWPEISHLPSETQSARPPSDTGDVRRSPRRHAMPDSSPYRQRAVYAEIVTPHQVTHPIESTQSTKDRCEQVTHPDGRPQIPDIAMAPQERLDAIAQRVDPCSTPAVFDGYDMCPCGYGGAFPCPTTEAAWLARGLDPVRESRRLIDAMRPYIPAENEL